MSSTVFKHIREVNALGIEAIELYRVSGDPLTKSAAILLLQALKLPLNEPQEGAARLISKQLEAYRTLYITPQV